MISVGTDLRHGYSVELPVPGRITLILDQEHVETIKIALEEFTAPSQDTLLKQSYVLAVVEKALYDLTKNRPSPKTCISGVTP